MHAADTHKLPAGSALAVDRDGFAADITAALEAEPLIDIDREESSRAAARVGQRHHRHRPADLAGARRLDPRAHRRRRALVLRRHRADRASRLDRFRRRLVPVALRQGRPRRLRRRLHQLPADARAIRRLHRCAACRRENRVPRFRDGDALFRRLPADRDHGRARPRDLAPRTDEAVRPHQPASADTQALCGRATAPGQQARHVVQHGRLPDQAEPRRTGAMFRTIPGLGMPSSRGSAGCIATPSSIRQSCSTRRCGSRQPRLRFAGQITGCEGYVESAAIGLLAGRFAAAERLGEPPSCRRRPPRMARSSATSPAAISRPSTPGRARFSR